MSTEKTLPNSSRIAHSLLPVSCRVSCGQSMLRGPLLAARPHRARPLPLPELGKGLQRVLRTSACPSRRASGFLLAQERPASFLLSCLEMPHHHSWTFAFFWKGKSAGRALGHSPVAHATIRNLQVGGGQAPKSALDGLVGREGDVDTSTVAAALGGPTKQPTESAESGPGQRGGPPDPKVVAAGVLAAPRREGSGECGPSP